MRLRYHRRKGRLGSSFTVDETIWKGTPYEGRFFMNDTSLLRICETYLLWNMAQNQRVRKALEKRRRL
jgi:hypothetical protein